MRRAAGFTLIELLIVIAIGLVILAICLPNLLQSRKNGNEADAIRSLKTIMTNESVFREGDREHDGNLDYGMLSELANTGLVDELLGSGTKAGYIFEATYSFSTSEFLWFARATPRVMGTTGDRYFCTNQAGVLFHGTKRQPVLDTNSCLLPQGDDLYPS